MAVCTPPNPPPRMRMRVRSLVIMSVWDTKTDHPTARTPPRSRRRASVLLAGGGGLAVACLALARVENLVEAPRTFLVLFGAALACYGAALWALTRLRGRQALWIVLTVALLARFALL